MALYIVIGSLIWLGIYLMLERVCACFERCTYYKVAKRPENEKVTAKDLYPKEKPND